MRKLLILLLCISSNLASAGETDKLLKVRNLYYQATENKKNLEEFENLLINVKDPDNTILGDIGMSFMLKAKYAWLPNYKMSYFNKGKDFLESAISNDPQNLELIFMRFCVQSNAPGFLFYSNNLRSDKAFILNTFNSIKDNDLKLRIINYMIEEKTDLTQSEINMLTKK